MEILGVHYINDCNDDDNNEMMGNSNCNCDCKCGKVSPWFRPNCELGRCNNMSNYDETDEYNHL